MPRAPPDEAVLISGIPLQGHCSSACTGFVARQKMVLLQEVQNLSLDVITMTERKSIAERSSNTLFMGFH